MKKPGRPLRKIDIASALNFQSREPVALAYHRATPVQHERAEQRALWQWVQTQPWHESFLHFPNERINRREAHRLKGEGVKPGPPDNWLFAYMPPDCGAVSELKRPGVTRSAVTADQRWWLLHLEHVGFQVGAHRGWQESAAFFAEFMGTDCDYVARDDQDWWR